MRKWKVAVASPLPVTGAEPRPEERTGRGSYRTLRRLGAAQGGGLFVALFGLGTYFTIASPAFLTRSNLLVVLLQVSILGMVAVPGSMLLLAGKIDLSVGSVCGLGAACFGQFDKIIGWPLGVSIAGALLVGALWGLMNGVLVAYLKFNPVIVTLGGYAGAAGVAQWITANNTRYGFGNAFAVLGNGTVAGIPVPVVIFAGVFLVGAYFWYETRTGRHLTAIGANTEAAQAVGVPDSQATLRHLCPVRDLGCGGWAHPHLSARRCLRPDRDGARAPGLDGDPARRRGVHRRARVALGYARRHPVYRRPVRRPHNHQRGPYVAEVFVGAALVVAAGLDVLYQRIERLPMEVVEIAPSKDKTAAGAGQPYSPAEVT